MNVFSVAFFRNMQSPYESERAGAGRGVFFVNYLRSLVRNHWAVWADWQLVIHHDEKAKAFPFWKCVERMADRGLLKTVYMGESKKLCASMLWRMLPAWNLSVDYLLCRDLDSLSTPRERRAIDKWMASGKAISSLHDSESHNADDLFGGLCGFKAQWIRDRWGSFNEFMGMADQLSIDLTYQGSDMRFLNTELTPKGLVAGEIVTETRATLGPKDHPIDQIGTHLGGAYHVDPAVEWFAANRSYCPKLDLIEECERA
jgi:hypothetical protein